MFKQLKQHLGPVMMLLGILILTAFFVLMFTAEIITNQCKSQGEFIYEGVTYTCSQETN